METFTEKQGCHITEDFLEQDSTKSFDTCILVIKKFLKLSERLYKLLSDDMYAEYYEWYLRLKRNLSNMNLQELFIITVSGILWYNENIKSYE